MPHVEKMIEAETKTVAVDRDETDFQKDVVPRLDDAFLDFDVVKARENKETFIRKNMAAADEYIKIVLNTRDTDEFFQNWRRLEIKVREMLLVEEHPMESLLPIMKYDDFVEDQRHEITKAFIERSMRSIEEIVDPEQKDRAYKVFYYGLEPYAEDIKEAGIEIEKKGKD